MLLRISFFLLLMAHLPACEDYFVVFLVNARQLDYSCSSKFLKTVAKHPSDWSKNGDVGHAWVYLKGDGIIEGGHSGELGVLQPRYMEGVMDNIALGARNPVSYLWCAQCDGFFQEGNGGHAPTYAAKVSLTHEQYAVILAYITNYNYQDYSLTGQQCSSFVCEIAKIAGIYLDDLVTLEIAPTFKHMCMWQDPEYQFLTFSSPDKLELSLKELVREGRAENVLRWYQRSHRKCLGCKIQKLSKTIQMFPGRIVRYTGI
jgi:hypothetical protein